MLCQLVSRHLEPKALETSGLPGCYFVVVLRTLVRMHLAGMATQLLRSLKAFVALLTGEIAILFFFYFLFFLISLRTFLWFFN